MRFLTLIVAAILVLENFQSAAVENTALTQPLPALEAIIEGAIARANRENKEEKTFKQHYSYTRSRVTEYRNASGELKSRKEKTSDKKPKAITTLTSQKMETETAGDQKREAAFDKKDFSLNRDMVNRFDLKLIGREMVRGRPALMVDFKPKSGPLPENNIKDRFINHAAGHVWLDEADFAVTKADVHLTQQVNVFGGVAGAIWKFTYALERERTDDGWWFVLSVNWHLEGREVLLRRFMDYHEFWTNVRKTQ